MADVALWRAPQIGHKFEKQKKILNFDSFYCNVQLIFDVIVVKKKARIRWGKTNKNSGVTSIVNENIFILITTT